MQEIESGVYILSLNTSDDQHDVVDLCKAIINWKHDVYIMDEYEKLSKHKILSKTYHLDKP